MRPDDDILAQLATDPAFLGTFDQFQGAITEQQRAIQEQADEYSRLLGFTVESGDNFNKRYRHIVRPDGTENYTSQEFYRTDAYEFFREMVEETTAAGTITKVHITQAARAGDNKELHPRLEVTHLQVASKSDATGSPHRSTWVSFGVPYETPLFASHFDTKGDPSCLVFWGDTTESFGPESETFNEQARHARSQAQTPVELLDIDTQLSQARDQSKADRAVVYWRMYPLRNRLFYYAYTNPEMGPIGPLEESDLADALQDDFGEDLYTQTGQMISRARVEKVDEGGKWLVIRNGVVQGDVIEPQLFICMRPQLDQATIADHLTPKQGFNWTKTNVYLPFNGALAPLDIDFDTEEIAD